jgi:hypothetical protein
MTARGSPQTGDFSRTVVDLSQKVMVTGSSSHVGMDRMNIHEMPE